MSRKEKLDHDVAPRDPQRPDDRHRAGGPAEQPAGERAPSIATDGDGSDGASHAGGNGAGAGGNGSDEVSLLLGQLQKMKEERDALFDRVARQQAEFDNVRKRMQREQLEFREHALSEAIKQLLPVIDNFDRALRTQGNENELRSGVELIRRQMSDVLSKLGVLPIPSVGETFDPRIHEAIEAVETNDAPENQIIAELQPGYRLKERLLRPAMVRIAHNPGKR